MTIIECRPVDETSWPWGDSFESGPVGEDESRVQAMQKLWKSEQGMTAKSQALSRLEAEGIDPAGAILAIWHTMLPDGRVRTDSRLLAPTTTCERAIVRELDDVRSWFTYHPPRAGQPQRYAILRDCGRMLAEVILSVVPAGCDRDAAIRKVREAIMTANAGIACEPAPDGG